MPARPPVAVCVSETKPEVDPLAALTSDASAPLPPIGPLPPLPPKSLAVTVTVPPMVEVPLAVAVAVAAVAAHLGRADAAVGVATASALTGRRDRDVAFAGKRDIARGCSTTGAAGVAHPRSAVRHPERLRNR